MFCLAGCSGQKLLKGFDQLRVVMQQLAYLQALRGVWCKVWNVFEISICRHAEFCTRPTLFMLQCAKASTPGKSATCWLKVHARCAPVTQ